MVAAVVLGAGFSRRMGSPKLLLPWEDTTVIGAIVRTLHAAEVQPVVVVAGASHAEIAGSLVGQPVQVVANPRYQEDSMLLSLHCGLACLPQEVPAALVVLGDQPQLSIEVIRLILDAYTRSGSPLVVPSYRMRRGHPWLIDRSLWGEIMGLPAEETMRSFMHNRAASIHYVETEFESVIQDLDTPEDYARFRPG